MLGSKTTSHWLWERKFHGTKVPRHLRSWEQKYVGTKVP